LEEFQASSLKLTRIYSHIVFVLKNSRYDIEKRQNKKPSGFIASTHPFIEGKEEEILVEVLCNVAVEIGLNIITMNFCGDHVHAVIQSEKTALTKSMNLWKGKSSYIFNRLINPSIETQKAVKSDGTKQFLWAKSFYQKVVEDDKQLKSTISYIKDNRRKHGLPPLSAISTARINKMILS
jgi:REP element-mobilizing transposase RayT